MSQVIIKFPEDMKDDMKDFLAWLWGIMPETYDKQRDDKGQEFNV